MHQVERPPMKDRRSDLRWKLASASAACVGAAGIGGWVAVDVSQLFNGGCTALVISAVFLVGASWSQRVTKLDDVWVTAYDRGYDDGVRSQLPNPVVVSLDKRRERRA